jgi:hypothetical protein
LAIILITEAPEVDSAVSTSASQSINFENELPVSH